MKPQKVFSVQCSVFSVGLRVWLAFCLLASAFCLPAAAATLTHTFLNPDGSAFTNTVLFRPTRNRAVYVAPSLTAYVDTRVTPGTNGAITATLRGGDYNVFLGATLQFGIAVPDSTNSFELAALISSPLSVTTNLVTVATVGDATASAGGKVKTDTTAVSPVVYLRGSVDALLAAKLAVTPAGSIGAGTATFTNVATFMGDTVWSNAAPVLTVSATNGASGLRVNVASGGAGEDLVRFQNAGATVAQFGATGNLTAQGDINLATGKGYYFDSLTGVRIRSGAGTPEGFISAPVGSVYLRNDGTAATASYHKITGTGATGWIERGNLANATGLPLATGVTGTLPVANGGSGRATGATAYGLLAAGTTATGGQQTIASGATTELLVGGGASALPVWTAASGSGAPVRATSPTLVTPNLGAATLTSASIANALTVGASITTTNHVLVGVDKVRIFGSGSIGIDNISLFNRYGADFTTGAARTDLTRKDMRMLGANFTNANPYVLLMFYFSAETQNALYLGGGETSMEAMNSIRFYTAPTKGVISGTIRGIIDAEGRWSIGAATPDINASLDLQSTARPILLTRQTAAQRAATATTAGLLTYQTDGTTGLYGANGSAWVQVLDARSGGLASATGLPLATGVTGSLPFANGGATGTAATSATTGAMTVNMTSSIVTTTPTGDSTFNASGGVTGQIATFHVTTSGAVSYVLTFGTNFKSAGTLATGTVSGAQFTVTFRCTNGTQWTEMARTIAM